MLTISAEPSYRFDSYEDGKPKWAPQTPTEDPRGNREYEDNRRDSRRHKERYEDDAPPPPKGTTSHHVTA
jgi:hypothetical protein